MTLTDTRDRAKQQAAEYADGMTGIPKEFYQQGFENGFRVGYAAAEQDRAATEQPTENERTRGRWTGDLRRSF